MPTIASLLDDSDTIEIETEPLFLPSSFTKEQREEFELHDLAEIEMKLRRGEASEAIMHLQKSLRKEIGRAHV